MTSSNSLNPINPGSNNGKQDMRSSSRTLSGGQTFEFKGGKTEPLQSLLCETNLTMSSLKTRLAPTFRDTLATALDSLLREVAVVLDDALTKTRRELVTQEQENRRLRLRLEVSEGELKALQECLCGAQKIIDHLPPASSVPGLGGTLGQQHGFCPPACGGNCVVHRDSSDSLSGQTDHDISGLPFSETLQGFDSGDDLKVCPLSIRADGTIGSSSPSSWSDVARPDECSRGQTSRQCVSEKEPGSSGPRAELRLEIKQEQDQGPAQRRAAGEGAVAAAAETEQTARNVAELGYIHVVEEESASRGRAARPNRLLPLPPPWLREGGGASPADGLKTPGRPLQGAGAEGSLSLAGPASPDADRPHLCLQCGKTFRLISSLKKHIRIHTGEKPYPCPVCGRCFRESGALKTHQRIHTGEKPYSCSDCGTSFRHLDGLRKHRRTHTGEKPYACGVCGKRLSRLQHLKHHQRIHTGERPCRCPRCHKSFKEPAALRKHLRTHREEPGGAGEEGAGAGRDVGGTGSGDGPVAPAAQLRHHLVLPPQMAFGVWGPDGEDGVVMNGV